MAKPTTPPTKQDFIDGNNNEKYRYVRSFIQSVVQIEGQG